MEKVLDFEQEDFFMPVDRPKQGVKKAAALFETDVFALISQADSAKAKTNTVYIFDGQRREVIGQKSITTTIDDVYFARFDVKTAGGGTQKTDGIIFFGGDEVHICDSADFANLRVIKAGANAGLCNSLLQGVEQKLLALNDSKQGYVKIVDLNKDFVEVSFSPFKDQRQASCIFMSEQANAIAVADSPGNYVAVFKLPDLTLINSYFLGYTSRKLKAVLLSPHLRSLACLSDSGTLHFFEVQSSQSSQPGRKL